MLGDIGTYNCLQVMTEKTGMLKTEKSNHILNHYKMKQRKFQTFILLLTATMLSSCSVMYQVIETSSSDAKLEKDSYAFENADLKISYNFWADGGRVYFFVTNKLDVPIYIDWDKSHLIYNGTSYEYWYDSEETNSFYSSASTGSSYTFADAIVNIFGGSAYGSGQSNTSATSRKVAVVASSKSKPKKVIQIPPRSSIIVSKFSISKAPFYNCDFNLRNTSYRTPNTKTFNKSDSPLSFRNYLTYSSKENFEQSKTIDNEFYISSISFMTDRLFFGKSSARTDCDLNGGKVYGKKYSRPYMKPTNFYIKVQGR